MRIDLSQRREFHRGVTAVPSAGIAAQKLTLALCLSVISCSKEPALEPTAVHDAGPTVTLDTGSGDVGIPQATTPNILLIIADDLGADVAPCLAPQAQRVPMPHIESLCTAGVVFKRAWANPTCSPTRATILTGRYGFRTGVGQQILGNTTNALPTTETTLPQIITPDYASAAIGKWHLANRSNGGPDHPESTGFDHYAGLMIGAHQDYYNWRRTEDGQTVDVAEYSTTRITDDAITWLDSQSPGKPWLLWIAYTAPHLPLHLPPADLHTQAGLTGDQDHINANPMAYYRAAAEALDSEVGRLFDHIGDQTLANTWIVFVGDNGSPGQVIPQPRSGNQAKGTLYEGGIHVPVVIAGPGLVEPGRHVDAPINLADLYSTLAELTGRERTQLESANALIDSVSLVPYLTQAQSDDQRHWIYSEIFGSEIDPARAGRTIRDRRYKLIRFDQGRDAFYDLESDPFETSHLSSGERTDEQRQRFDQLSNALTDLSGQP